MTSFSCVEDRRSNVILLQLFSGGRALRKNCSGPPSPQTAQQCSSCFFAVLPLPRLWWHVRLPLFQRVSECSRSSPAWPVQPVSSRHQPLVVSLAWLLLELLWAQQQAWLLAGKSALASWHVDPMQWRSMTPASAALFACGRALLMSWKWCQPRSTRQSRLHLPLELRIASAASDARRHARPTSLASGSTCRTGLNLTRLSCER